MRHTYILGDALKAGVGTRKKKNESLFFIWLDWSLTSWDFLSLVINKTKKAKGNTVKAAQCDHYLVFSAA